jgi:hypothetical protein
VRPPATTDMLRIVLTLALLGPAAALRMAEALDRRRVLSLAPAAALFTRVPQAHANAGKVGRDNFSGPPRRTPPHELTTVTALSRLSSLVALATSAPTSTRSC